jgi:hypothetical protein
MTPRRRDVASSTSERVVRAKGPILPRTMRRTFPNAQRLGRATDSVEVQSDLARAIYHDHALALARMSVVLALQLVAG